MKSTIVSQHLVTPRSSYPSEVESSGKGEQKEPAKQVMVPQSWAMIAAAAPKVGGIHQKVAGLRDSTPLNKSEVSPVEFSNIEMTKGGMSWIAHDPTGDSTIKNGVLPRVLRPRVKN